MTPDFRTDAGKKFENPKCSVSSIPNCRAPFPIKLIASMTTSARDIAPSSNRLERTVPLSVSTSPTATFHSPPSSFGGALLTRKATGTQPPKPLKPFDTQDIKILLLENVNQSGKDILAAQGYQVEALKTSLPEDQLIEKIRYGLSWK
jgi:D-3-phosphoglycerate dehydrogenase